MGLHKWGIDRNLDMSMSQLASYNFVLGFLVVFRSQQAYSRFWEGATIVQQVRGEWFNAISSCFAFCTINPDKQEEVAKFQHLLIRLASLLYCTALQQIAVLEDEAFEILDIDGISQESLSYLAQAPEKSLVILQWMQCLIVRSCENGIVSAPPPIVSRIYQELSRGIVNIVNAQKITDIIFPFPYAQMVSVMLMISSVVTPVVMATIMEDIFWCGLLTFMSVFCFWSINYIASEIEMPFGDDENDLPVANLQHSMNGALVMLIQDQCKRAPEFELKEKHWDLETIPCPFYLITDVQHRVFGEDSHKGQRLTKADKNALTKIEHTLKFADDLECNDKESTVIQALNSVQAKHAKRMSDREAGRTSLRVSPDSIREVASMTPMSSMRTMSLGHVYVSESSNVSGSARICETGVSLTASARQESGPDAQAGGNAGAVGGTPAPGDAGRQEVLLDDVKAAAAPDKTSLETSIDHMVSMETVVAALTANFEAQLAKISADLKIILDPRSGLSSPAHSSTVPDAIMTKLVLQLQRSFSFLAQELDKIVWTISAETLRKGLDRDYRITL